MVVSSSPRPSRTLALVLVVILIVVCALFGFTYLTNADAVYSRDTRISALEAYSATANATIAADNAKIVADASQISAFQDNASTLQYQVSQDMSIIIVLDGQISKDKATFASLNSSYYSLKSQISQDQSTIASLNTSVSQDQSTIASLNSQVSSLQSQVSSLQAASLAGSFSSTTSVCGLLINCSYTINGAYANYGMNAANSASVTFTFYSGSNATGYTLCSTTVVLGLISGRSVNLLPSTTCSSSSSTAAKSFNWSFSS